MEVLYHGIKTRYAYDFPLCFPHELLMSLRNIYIYIYIQPARTNNEFNLWSGIPPPLPPVLTPPWSYTNINRKIVDSGYVDYILVVMKVAMKTLLFFSYVCATFYRVIPGQVFIIWSPRVTCTHDVILLKIALTFFMCWICMIKVTKSYTKCGW